MKTFAVPKNFLKLKIYCTLSMTLSLESLIWFIPMCIAKGILRVSTKFLNMILISLLFFNPQNVADNPFERVQDVTTSLHFKDFAEKFNTRLEDLNNSLQVTRSITFQVVEN